MKIVRIIARLNVGGPATHVILLTRGFRQRGHESHLLVGPVPEGEGSMEYLAAAYDVAFTRIDKLVRPISPLSDLTALWEIFRFLRRERPDVVHTHTSKAGTLGRIAAVMAGTPAIFHTFHGSVFDGYFSSMQTRLFLSVERFLARLSTRLITVSATLRKQLSEQYHIAPANRIEVVRLGFDLTEFARTFEFRRERTNSPSGPIVIGWVGRLTEIKDPLLFVEVASAMSSTGVNARFVMVGDGPLRQAVERAVSRAGLCSVFSLLGWQRNMAEIYAHIDLIVSTSRNEGTSVAIIEAMAAGCPFVAPNVGGLIDLTDGEPEPGDGFHKFANGILVSQRETAAFARGICELVSNAHLRKCMAEAGHEFALKNFCEDRLVRETEALYRRFLSGRNAADA